VFRTTTWKPSSIVSGISNHSAFHAKQNTDEITRALKSLAIELDLPILLLSRLGHSKSYHY